MATAEDLRLAIEQAREHIATARKCRFSEGAIAELCVALGNLTRAVDMLAKREECHAPR